jgi:copper(I)-binding protein
LPARSNAPRLCLGTVLALLGVAAGCGGPAADRGQAGAGTPSASLAPTIALEVREARASLMPGMGVAYLTVVNTGPSGDRLVRVETAAARAAETHETVEENGVMRMRARPGGFEVPAGGSLELQPGGKHIMLVEPVAPEAAAGAIRLTLHFERAGAIEVRAPLTAMGSSSR